MPKPSSSIPAGFMFSQSSLQDYLDCPRRFELRYLLRIAWPAPQDGSVAEQECDLLLGQRFHHMAQQYLLGVPPERLAVFIDDPDLALWWDNFLAFAQQVDLKACLRACPEASLTAGIGGQRLVAQYDLIVSGPQGRLTIYDWKAYRKRPRRAWLAGRMQSRVYPYLLVLAGCYLNAGRPVAPETVEMIYWFAAYPDKPEHFLYKRAQFEKDQADLAGLIAEIVQHASLPQALGVPAQTASNFPLTSHAERCVYCNYRSLCERVEHAEAFDEDSELELHPPEMDGIHFEQIGEISF